MGDYCSKMDANQRDAGSGEGKSNDNNKNRKVPALIEPVSAAGEDAVNILPPPPPEEEDGCNFDDGPPSPHHLTNDDDSIENDEDYDKAQHQQQHHGNETNGSSDSGPPTSGAKKDVYVKRRKKGVGGLGLMQKAPSLFRVGSKRTPASPARASNYNHVRYAVSQNLQEAASERSKHCEKLSAQNGGQPLLPLGAVGLRNLGNTCFMNSSLQCLSATIPLTDYFLGYDYRSEINKDNFLGTGGKLVVAYAELMKLLWLGKHQVVKPNAFKAQLEKFAPQFVGTRQHDAQELLSFLLDGIHEDLNRIKKKPYIEDPDYDGTNNEEDAIEAWKNYLRRDKSLIVDVFQGQLRNTCQCLSCGHKNIRFDPVMYLSLPIPDKQGTITLNDCLNLYLKQDQLRGDNQWYCTKCKSHRDAERKTDIWIMPPILIIHMKRFRYNEYGHMGSKNNAAIDYPINDWDLSSFVKSKGSEKPLYDLYAVSNHIGGLGSGHYTAYAKNRFDDFWYEFNDSSCRRIQEYTLKQNSSSAYLLFYNRSFSSLGMNDAGGDGENSTMSGGGCDIPRRGVPLIRRQSVSRPDLWPHTQVQDSQFREFTRHSVANILCPSLAHTTETVTNETSDTTFLPVRLDRNEGSI